MRYDFAKLSPDDFQLLVRDLLQAELAVRVETFADGADEGIDLRCIGAGGETLIVQCKRIADFRSLLRVVRNKEVLKVQRLKPHRYILATSARLNPQRKRQLLSILRPFCKDESDILGADDLNNYLTAHPDVERRNFKLWLPSVVLLDRILHDGIFGEDQAALERARERLRRYVRNPSLDRAMALLESERYCIVAGQPGIGKSTLADILVLDHVERQGFEAVKISRSLDEVRLRRNPHRRLIFYFDDFLGQTLVEQFTRIEDRRLVDFIEDVRRTPNWRLVLTTREYVYQQATIKLEALANAAHHLKKCIINLEDYTSLIRARILYNHLYYSDVPAPLIQALVAKRRYLDIIRHRNYNPRIVQYMTMDLFYKDLPPKDYPVEFVRNLDNPHRIWSHTFHQNISREAQDLLLVLASFPEEALLSDLQLVFHAYHQRRSSALLSPMSSRAFENALRELDGDFIATAYVGAEMLVEFSNPSIRDFLNAAMSASPAEVEDLIATASFFEQVSRIWRTRLSITPPSKFVRNDVLLAARLGELIDSDSPRVRRDYHKDWSVKRVVRTRSSRSERLLSILEIAEELQTPATKALVQTLLGDEEDYAIDLDTFGKEALVDVLVRLQKRKAWAATSSRLYEMVRKFLVESLEEPDDYKILTTFASAIPGAFSPAEWAGIQRRLEASFDDWKDNVWYDSDDIWSLHSDIEEIGQNSVLSVQSMMFDLQIRAEELEDEKTTTPETPYRSTSEASSDESKEIDALFASLARA